MLTGIVTGLSSPYVATVDIEDCDKFEASRKMIQAVIDKEECDEVIGDEAVFVILRKGTGEVITMGYIEKVNKGYSVKEAIAEEG